VAEKKRSLMEIVMEDGDARGSMANKQGPRANRMRKKGEKTGFEFIVVLYIVEFCEYVWTHARRTQKHTHSEGGKSKATGQI
jgi:hypothetical protein